MKTFQTEGYYRRNHDHLFSKHEREWHCDFEKMLGWRIPTFEELPEEVREQAIAALTKIEAKRIAEQATKELLEKKRMIRDIKEGKASLGYTTKMQGIHAWFDLQEGFEFTCLQLADFRKKYGV